jgi:hypothetical protein
MSFINTDENKIKFSEAIYEIGTDCPVVTTESGARITTTGGLELEQDCIPDRFACYGLCSRQNSDSYFTITNTCSNSFTLTGFEVTNPEMFSLFETSYNLVDSYNQETVPEIFPIRLGPNESIRVPTFFVPPEWVLEYGKKGTFENRDGDKFSSEVKVYPGFPGDGANALDCDTRLILSGELICEEKDPDDFTFLNNEEQLVKPLFPLKVYNPLLFRNEYRLKATPLYTNNNLVEIPELIKNYADWLDSQNWFQTISSNWAITGCIDLMYKYFQDKTIEKKFELTTVNHVSTSYFSQKNGLINNYNYMGDEYIGYKVDTVAENLPFGYVRDQAMFIKVNKGGKSDKIFLCEVPPGNVNFSDFDIDSF